MTNSLLNKNSPNVLSICVDEDDDSKKEISVYSCFLERVLQFDELSQVILAIDELFENINFPQSSTKERSFFKTNEQADARKESKQYMSPKEITEQKGSKGTFVVHVQYRQNATWQGSVVWAEKNITKNFRSALELLKLIDGALDETDIENK